MIERFLFENGWFTGEVVGQCIDFTFNNIRTGGKSEALWEYMGNKVIALMNPGDIPDVFTVLPAPGWEVMTTNPLSVAEWATGVITVCQMAFS